MSAPLSAPLGISLREFARRDGCNDKLVRRAIESGHLQTLSDGKLDPALVGTDWRLANRRGADTAADRGADTPDCPQPVRTVSAPAPAARSGAPRMPESTDGMSAEQLETALRGGLMSLVDAERAKENALALKHILGARRAAGEVVDIGLAEGLLFEHARAMRDAWLNWPSRVGPLVAADLNVPADKVTENLTLYVHQHLAELGEPDVDFGTAESD